MKKKTFEELKKANRKVTAHRESAFDVVNRHEAVCHEAVAHGPPGIGLLSKDLFYRASHEQVLLVAYCEVMKNGNTPGIDGVTTDMIDSNGGCFPYLHSLRDAIRDNSYQPSPVLTVNKPKADGLGFRTLSIPTVADRVVQTANLLIVQPLIDPRFHTFSVGFRPEKARDHALALAEVAMAGGHTVVVAEDLANAFDNVSQSRLMQIVAKYIPDKAMVKLIEKIVGMKSDRGILQGGPLSPLLFNLYVHHVIDSWLSRQKSIIPVRYGDNLALFCTTQKNAVRAREGLSATVRSAGFTLKGTEPSHFPDLGGGEGFTWLGYDIRFVGQNICATIPDAAIDHMKAVLGTAGPHSKDILCGWIAQQGPTYSEMGRGALLADMCQAIPKPKHRPDLKGLRLLWSRAGFKWLNIKAAYDPAPDIME